MTSSAAILRYAVESRVWRKWSVGVRWNGIPQESGNVVSGAGVEGFAIGCVGVIHCIEITHFVVLCRTETEFRQQLTDFQPNFSHFHSKLKQKVR